MRRDLLSRVALLALLASSLALLWVRVGEPRETSRILGTAAPPLASDITALATVPPDLRSKLDRSGANEARPGKHRPVPLAAFFAAALAMSTATRLVSPAPTMRLLGAPSLRRTLQRAPPSFLSAT